MMKLNTSYFCLIKLLLVLIVFSANLNAQQSTQYTHYLYNQLSINPAYAGNLSTLDAVLIYRDQWSSIEGAPVSQSLSLHSPLKNEKLGLGLDIQNDKLGPAKQFYANANLSYTLPLNNDLKFAFGVKAGFKVFNLDFSSGQGDDLAFEDSRNRVTPTLGIGSFLYKNNWYLGFSVLDILTDRYYDRDQENVADEEVQYFLTGGYVIDISKDVRLKPTFLAKYLAGFPLVVDVSANFLLYNKLSLGLAYRYEDAVSGLAGFYFLDGFFAGYSYDFTVSQFNNNNTGGSHELLLKYTMPIEDTVVEFPRYF